MRLLRAGEHPPCFVAYCALCCLPVARFMYRVPKEDTDSVEFEAQCCGKTQGRRVKLAEMYRLQVTGEKMFLVVGKRRHQEIRSVASR